MQDLHEITLDLRNSAQVLSSFVKKNESRGYFSPLLIRGEQPGPVATSNDQPSSSAASQQSLSSTSSDAEEDNVSIPGNHSVCH